MSLLIEILELLSAIIPAMVAVGLAFRGAAQAWAWFVIVLGSAFLAVLSVGVLLSRLIARCGDPLPACAEGLVAQSRLSGVFAHCYSCVSPDHAFQISAIINSWLIPIQACSAAICVIASAIATIRFVVWAKRLLRGASES
jgi:hypothetical protein